MASLLADFHSFKGNIKTVCNNQAVINKCGNLSTGQLKNHWETNFDLYFTQQHYKGTLSTEWVRGHADKSPWFTPIDLILQNLSREEIFNIWSDKIAKHSWNQGAVECLTLTHHPQNVGPSIHNFPSLTKLLAFSKLRYMQPLHTTTPANTYNLVMTYSQLNSTMSHAKPVRLICYQCHFITVPPW